ncbi:contact-dependent growth inhibition system immunity protein [Nocardioides mangrovi]|uniref:CdiI immunity protein domain-containing protein n=1 Tax=Nocardioides mangrovi TaxID=2874580 RepID=A0ABS7U9U4_9ACTN|nr:contact-dependent growth inhibition system immunity protein [Nocardioides mangrovi]MBZ5737640.1 hypothetical protein [Nocardioides mangrovi]
MTSTPALWSFVGIYFNQDWPEDYGTEEASIDSFAADDPASVASLVTEIRWVLDQFHTEEQLADYLDSQGSEYLPPTDQDGYRGWLERITGRLQAPST